jgi:ferric-dicitrate binding protein FerR (iron transport regulator)
MKDTGKQYFNQLLKKYRLGTATPEEIQFLESFYNMFEVNDDLVTDENEQTYSQLKNRIKNNIDERIDRGAITDRGFKIRRLVIRYAAAAAILIFGGVFTWFAINTHRQKNAASQAVSMIKPGGVKATLTLASGIKINLDSAVNGIIAHQANVSIHKNSNGLLVYTIGSSSNPTAAATVAAQNTISTPMGGQYEVVLPDGTHVTLNSASSLTYPVAFTGHERDVELKGEAYFEVAKDKTRPFRVSSGIQTVTVLGTHFNINAYSDEATIKTTLLEGSVEVAAAGNKGLIVPGQQMVVQPQAGTLYKRNVNTDKEVAWKNGFFSFDGDDLKAVMRQVARWYNVDVAYSGNLANDQFYGEIPRSSKLADVLKIMEINNVHFDIDGRRITVSYTSKK